VRSEECEESGESEDSSAPSEERVRLVFTRLDCTVQQPARGYFGGHEAGGRQGGGVRGGAKPSS
jgi:hypothetical protein